MRRQALNICSSALCDENAQRCTLADFRMRCKRFKAMFVIRTSVAAITSCRCCCWPRKTVQWLVRRRPTEVVKSTVGSHSHDVIPTPQWTETLYILLPPAHATWSCLRSCVSVCNAPTFESLDLDGSLLTCRYIFRMARLSSYIMVIGQGHRTKQRPSLYPVCGCSAFDWKAIMWYLLKHGNSTQTEVERMI